MAVALEGTIKRYIGLSTDRKPTPRVASPDGSVPLSTDILPGSSFLETDTYRIFRWSGSEWTYTEPEDRNGLLLESILFELRSLRERIDLVTA